MAIDMQLRGGEIIIIVTAIIGFGGTAITQWATSRAAAQSSIDAIATREQDRLDREQKLEEMLARSAMEIDLLQARSQALKVQLAQSSRQSQASTQELKEAVRSQAVRLERNTAQTIETRNRAIDAFHEANTVNEKLERIGEVNTKLEQAVKRQSNRIEAKVDEVHEAVVKEE